MKKNKIYKRILIFCAFFFVFSEFLFANESSVAHLKGVSVISSNGSGVFSAGKDGFLIKWQENDLGEHYQISELNIKKIAQSPNGIDVAVYETDGALFNRVSVWDWENQRRKFAFRFNESVTSLSFSAQGTYVIVGTAAQNGLFLINSSSGKIEPKKIDENIASFSFSATGASEQNLVLYSPLGQISYYNLQNGAQKAKFDVESALSNVTMFANSIFLAGIKDRSVVVLHALNGRTAGKFSAANSVIVHNCREHLFYITNEQRQFRLYRIQNKNGRTVGEPELVRTYGGLKSDDKITSAAFFGDFIYAGTESGNVYKFESYDMERVEVLSPITDDRYDTVLDISSVGADCYILTPDLIFQSAYDESAIDKRARNSNGHTNIATADGGVVLWSRGSRKSVLFVSMPDGKERTIFTPSGVLQSLRVFGNYCVTVEADSVVNRYALDSGKKETLYTGSSLTDALLLSETDLYVSKTAATNPATPLLYVDTKTQETVPLSLSGSFAYSLDFDESNANEIYGIVVSSSNGKQNTNVFSFDTQKRTARTFLPFNEEDTDAFLSVGSKNVYTNVGKSQARAYNVQTRRDFLYERGESMPQKIVRAGNRVAILNRNGSISWYNANVAKISATWYLNADGKWLEL